MGNMLMAVSTWAGWPMLSSALHSASELITVANMPIWSPLTRSKPWAAPLRPRNMLPPPMTMATCTPASAISLIW